MEGRKLGRKERNGRQGSLEEAQNEGCSEEISGRRKVTLEGRKEDQ